jgi:choline dehydrogenase-like flavoprotein
MNAERFEVVVVGSGAGGGIVAAELAVAGRNVLLLECGPHRSAADHTRWEARANHELWWPAAFAEPPSPELPPMVMFRGRCVGGTTTINTKVALRPCAEDYEKWHAAAGLVNDGGDPFGEPDLLPYLERVERRLGVRQRSDWQQCVKTVEPGFKALGAELEPVMSYTDANCMRCGSCLQGCPTNAGKSSLNAYIQPAVVESGLELRADCDVRRVLIEDRRRPRGDGRRVPRCRGRAAARRRRSGRGRGGRAWHSRTAAALRGPRGGRRLAERPSDWPQPRIPCRATGRRAVR